MKRYFPKHDVFWKRALHICEYMYTCTHFLRALFQNMKYVLSIDIANSFCGFGLITHWEKSLQICTHTHIYIHIYEELFSKS